MTKAEYQAHFWADAHRLVASTLVDRDPGGWEAALSARSAVTWLRDRFASTEVDSYPGLHKFAAMAVGVTLRQLTDSDPRVLSLYEDWISAQRGTSDALRIAASR